MKWKTNMFLFAILILFFSIVNVSAYSILTSKQIIPPDLNKIVEPIGKDQAIPISASTTVLKEPTVTIKSLPFGFGSTLMTIGLIDNSLSCDTECSFVWEVNNTNQIQLGANYNDDFRLDFQDVDTGKNIDIPLNYEIATTTHSELRQTGSQCNPTIFQNGSVGEDCQQVMGKFEVPDWTPFDYHNGVLPQGHFYIKGTGIKEHNQVIDWIPTILSTKLDIWAKWGVVSSYANYTFDDNTTQATQGKDTGTGIMGNVSIGGNSVYSSSVIIDNRSLFSGNSSTDFINTSASLPFYTQTGSWAFWFRPRINTSLMSGRFLFLHDEPGNVKGDFGIQTQGYDGYGSGGGINIEFNDPDGVIQLDTNQTNFIANTWYHIVEKLNASGVYVYVNGTKNNQTIINTQNASFYGSNRTEYFFGGGGGGKSSFISNWYWDENKFFNLELSDSQILDMYDTEAGISPAVSNVVSLISPPDGNLFGINNITFNATITPTGGDLTNITLFVWNSTNDLINQTTNTVLGNFTNSSIWNLFNLQDGLLHWNALGCNSNATASYCNYSFPSNFSFTVSTQIPFVSLFYPAGVITFPGLGSNLSINWTILSNNTALSNCYFDYKNVNHTVSCFANSSQINITDQENRSLIFYVNDTSGNIGSNITNWTYSSFINNNTYNISTFETAFESYSVNISIPNGTSVSSATMVYNNTIHNADFTNTSSTDYVLNTSFDIPNGNYSNSFYWNMNLSNGTLLNTTTFNQNVALTNLTICGSSPQNVPYINFTFANEVNLDTLNGSIDTSTWTYWLGSGTVNKTLSFSNSSSNPSYAFCLFPGSRTLNTNVNLRYSNTGFPQRSYAPNTLSLTNTTTNQILYLLSSTDGIYSSIQTVQSLGIPIPGVNVIIERIIGTSYVIIGSQVSDDAGIVTFWVDPNFDHRITATKDGYITQVVIIRPSQSLYSLIMSQINGGGNASFSSSTAGMRWTTFPQSGQVPTGVVDYGLNLTASLGNLVSCRLDLVRSDNNNTIATVSGGNATGCNITVTNSIPFEVRIFGKYYISTTSTNSTYFLIDTDSLWYLFEQNLSTSSNIQTLFREMSHIPEFGSTELRNEYSRVIIFYFILTVLLAMCTYFTEYDRLYPGWFVVFLFIIIFMASQGGFLTLNFGSSNISDTLKKYTVALISFLITGGYLMNRFATEG